MKKFFLISVSIILAFLTLFGVWLGTSYALGGQARKWFDKENLSGEQISTPEDGENTDDEIPWGSSIQGVKFLEEDLNKQCKFYNETVTDGINSKSYAIYTSPFDVAFTLYAYDEFGSVKPYDKPIMVESIKCYGGVYLCSFSDSNEFYRTLGVYANDVLKIEIVENEVRLKVHPIDIEELDNGLFVNFGEFDKPYFNITLKTEDGNYTFNFLPSYGINRA